MNICLLSQFVQEHCQEENYSVEKRKNKNLELWSDKVTLYHVNTFEKSNRQCEQRAQMFLIIGLVQYDTSICYLCKITTYRLFLFILYLIPYYSKPHFGYYHFLKTCFSQTSMPLEPTLILPRTLNHRHGSNLITLASAPVNLPVLFPPQQSPLYPGGTSTVRLLYAKKNSIGNMHPYRILFSFHRRLPSMLKSLFSVPCTRHMAIILWIKWNINLTSLIPTCHWSFHGVSTAFKQNIFQASCVRTLQFYKKNTLLFTILFSYF